MPEETETEQKQDIGAEVEEAVEEAASASADEPEAEEAAQEADKPKPEPFDQKRAEAKIRKANSEAEGLRKRLKELQPLADELQRIKDAEKSDTERLNDQLAAANARIEKTRKRLVTTKVQALAAAGSGERAAFADPEDAAGALDLDSYIDSDGDIDEAAIEADLAALLERKPHWAKPIATQPQEGSRRPAPDRTQASGAKQTRTLTPEDEFAGFLKARLK